MEFLSNLSLVQRAGGAAVLILILVLLLVKQRQGQGKPATADATSGKAAKASKVKASKSDKGSKTKEPKAKSRSFGKGRKKADAEEAPTAGPKVAATGRMVPRLPSPVGADSGEFDALADPLSMNGHSGASVDGVINEPGWPSGPESWNSDATAPAAAAEPVGHDDALDALAETPPADDAGWATGDPGEAFDPATGWGEDTSNADSETSSWEAPVEAAASEPVDEFDWNAAEDAMSWDAPAADAAEPAATENDWESDADTAPVWTAVAEAAAPALEPVEAPDATFEPAEDETSVWAAPEGDTPLAWDPNEPEVEEPVEETVADELTATDWSAPEPAASDEAPVAESAQAEADDAEAMPEFVWEPADDDPEADEPLAVSELVEEIAAPVEVEAAATTPWKAPVEVDTEAEPVAEIEVESPAAAEPVMELPVEVTEPVLEPHVEIATPMAAAPVIEAPIENPAPVTAEPVVEIASDPVVAEPVVEIVPDPVVELPVEVAPVAESIHVDTPAIELPEAPALAAAEHVVETPAFESAILAPIIPVEEPVEVAPAHITVPVAASVVNPAARWAAMEPAGGGRETVSSADPAASWARLQPSARVTAPAGARAVAEPEAISAPSVAWWDVPSGVESDPRRGRFALGGYALQEGHPVVSGVTFRDGVVPPPHAWMIGPVMGAVTPGTLVLEVDGILNCRVEDLTVLMDHGFAPTTEGFSLRLLAASQGPFAVSGTYRIS